MSWTDERVSLLKKLWGEGKTAAEIAKELGGVTRNAVIGKAHRLKLSNRVSPIQQNKKPANTSTPPAKKQEKKPARVVEQNNKKPVIKKEDLVGLLELNNRMCRWPEGDPQQGDFGFCGGDIYPGLPYCADHSKVAYQAATRNRILKEEEADLESVSAAELKAAKKVLAR